MFDNPITPTYVPVIPKGDMHMRTADDTLACPVTPRPYTSQITDDPHGVTCPACLKIMNKDARS